MNNPPESRPMPDRLRRWWRNARDNASSGKSIGALAGGVAFVLVSAVVIAVVTTSGGPRPAEAEASAQKGLDLIADHDPGDFPPDGVYRITTGDDLCLTAKEAKPDALVLTQTACDEAADLTVFAVDEGVYRITGTFGAESGTCLAVTDTAPKPGRGIAAATCADDATQTFVTVPLGEKTFALATATSGMCLAPQDGSTKSGAEIHTARCDADVANQRLRLKPQDAKPKLLPVTGRYQVRSGHSKLCLGQGPEAGNEKREVLVQLDCDAEQSGLTLNPDRKGTKTRIDVDAVAEQWANCLAADPPGDADGYLFGATKCAADKLQYFVLEPYGGGVFRIKVKSSGLCLGIKGQSRESGVQADMTDCVAGRKSQLFTLDRETALASEPTKFGAWWSDDAQEWGAKWEAPATDGGAEVTGYRVEDCSGNMLAESDPGTFTVDMLEPADGCVSVRAVTDAGLGERAWFQIEE